MGVKYLYIIVDMGQEKAINCLYSCLEISFFNFIFYFYFLLRDILKDRGARV